MNEIIVVKIIIKITVVKNLNGRSGLKQNPVWHDGISLLPTRKSEQKKCNNWYHKTNTFYTVSKIIECDVSEIYLGSKDN